MMQVVIQHKNLLFRVLMIVVIFKMKNYIQDPLNSLKKLKLKVNKDKLISLVVKMILTVFKIIFYKLIMKRIAQKKEDLNNKIKTKVKRIKYLKMI